MATATITSYAKINLHLQVIGRRPDGYHELRTLLQSVDLADTLSASTRDDAELVLEVQPPAAVPSDERNLVLRAAEALREHTGARLGATITLDKHLPVGAGLGGGSSNAAATLVLLNNLWQLGLTSVELASLGAGLGSDVPFFFVAGLALGFGRGDELCSLADLPELGVVIAWPEETISTASVYGDLPRVLTWRQPDATVYCFSAGLGDRPAWCDLYNDLQPVVEKRWPQVAAVRQRMAALGSIHTAMTGSGAAVFALFADRHKAREAALQLDQRQRVHAGVTLTRAQSRLYPSQNGLSLKR